MATNPSLNDFLDAKELAPVLGTSYTGLHDKGKSGEITEPVKTGHRAARWPRYEAILMQKALMAECTKAQRVHLATFLTNARRSAKSAEQVMEEGLAMIAECVEANDKAKAA